MTMAIEDPLTLAEHFAQRCATATGPLLLSAVEAQQFGQALGALLAAHRELFDECWEWYRRYYGLLAALGQQPANDPDTV
jgi:hypothetical protein